MEDFTFSHFFSSINFQFWYRKNFATYSKLQTAMKNFRCSITYQLIQYNFWAFYFIEKLKFCDPVWMMKFQWCIFFRSNMIALWQRYQGSIISLLHDVGMLNCSGFSLMACCIKDDYCILLVHFFAVVSCLTLIVWIYLHCIFYVLIPWHHLIIEFDWFCSILSLWSVYVFLLNSLSPVWSNYLCLGFFINCVSRLCAYHSFRNDYIPLIWLLFIYFLQVSRYVQT